MLHRLLTLAALLAACAVTGRAGEYRHQDRLLVSCLQGTTARDQRRECIQESNARCDELGLEHVVDQFEEARRE